jgi:hypothetical protein
MNLKNNVRVLKTRTHVRLFTHRINFGMKKECVLQASRRTENTSARKLNEEHVDEEVPAL